MIIYAEMIGDRLIQVDRQTSWYHILVNSTETGRYHGKAPAATALRAERTRIYNEIEHLPTPERISPLACKLIAWSVKELVAQTIDPETLPETEPALRQIYLQAMRKQAIETAVFRASAYMTAVQRTRTQVPDEQIKFYMGIVPTAKWKMPRNWRSIYQKMQRYAATSLQNLSIEGGVNQAWQS